MFSHLLLPWWSSSHQLIWSIGGVYGLPTAGERDISSLSLLVLATATSADALRACSFNSTMKKKKRTNEWRKKKKRKRRRRRKKNHFFNNTLTLLTTSCSTYYHEIDCGYVDRRSPRKRRGRRFHWLIEEPLKKIVAAMMMPTIVYWLLICPIS